MASYFPNSRGSSHFFGFSPWPFSSVSLLVIVRSNMLAFIGRILFLHAFVFYVLWEHYRDIFVGSILNSYLRHHSNDIIFQVVIEVGKHLGYDTLHCYLFLFICFLPDLLQYDANSCQVSLCFIYLCAP